MPPVPSPQVVIPLERQDEIERLASESFHTPVLVFKHSATCGTSFVALEEIETYRQQPGALDVYLVEVLSQRPISNEIARRFAVRHQSPQALLLVDGQVAWHASHYGVTADALARAVREAAAQRGQEPGTARQPSTSIIS